jgi:hypothetical protein
LCMLGSAPFPFNNSTKSLEHGPPLSDLTALSDPWFSSLWTLQEAFLRTDAVFISRDAQIALVPQVSRNPPGEFHPELFHPPHSHLFRQCLKDVRRERRGYQTVVGVRAPSLRPSSCPWGRRPVSTPYPYETLSEHSSSHSTERPNGRKTGSTQSSRSLTSA